MLIRSWYSDHLMIAHSCVQQRVIEAAGAQLRNNVVSVTNPVAPPISIKPNKNFPPQPVSPPGPVDDEITLYTQDNMPFTIPKFAAPWFTGKRDAKSVEKLVQANYSKNASVFHRAFRVVCKNCYYGGQGVWAHSIGQYQQNGTKCFLPCLKCKGIRWTSTCPNKEARKN